MAETENGKSLRRRRAKEEGVATCTNCHPEGKCGPRASGLSRVDEALPALGSRGSGVLQSPARDLTLRRQAVSVHSVELNRTAVCQLLFVK